MTHMMRSSSAPATTAWSPRAIWRRTGFRRSSWSAATASAAPASPRDHPGLQGLGGRPAPRHAAPAHHRRSRARAPRLALSSSASPRSSCHSPTASMSSLRRRRTHDGQHRARSRRKDAAAFPRFDEYTARIARIIGDFMLKPQPSLPQFAAAFTGARRPRHAELRALLERRRLSRALLRVATMCWGRWPMAPCPARPPVRARLARLSPNSITQPPSSTADSAAGRSRSAAWVPSRTR